MKYKQHLQDNIAPEYGPDPYLNYRGLDDIIRVLSGKSSSSISETTRQVSLTTPPPTDSKGQPMHSSETEEVFYSALDKEIAKVESFTLAQVTALRKKVDDIEKSLQDTSSSTSIEEITQIRANAESVGDDFIRLEKYVNLNFMGFHKILKKHDKYLPSTPCKSFYVNRMHAQAWVRGDYSDVVVRLSNIFSLLRRDKSVAEVSAEHQSFLRSTTKYWIKTEDVSRVKYFVLRHLPVFLQKTSTGESDSQLTNSVYLDNDQLELYHGRLDKTPGAIAIRLRWYGTGDPRTVFVERKTHRDSWTGEISVKERFVIDEAEVKQVMTDTYPIPNIKRDMMANKGTTKKETDEWEVLAREITQVVQSKQLVPTMRTQYMRTAFQIPFDSTVRISLDTNLCMISERGYDLQEGARWHRDSSITLQQNEITRFPHAVLEIKLELSEQNASPPQWVQDLQNSGLLYEVHKFSKFIHGCATLLPEYVRSVPYWVDDASVRDSILACGAGRILVQEEKSEKDGRGSRSAGTGPGANKVYDHLLPFGTVTDNQTTKAVGRTASSMPKATTGLKPTEQQQKSKSYQGIAFYNDADQIESSPYIEQPFEKEEQPYRCTSWLTSFCCPAYSQPIDAPTSIQKIEPKVFFANERTYLHWLHAGVTLSTIAAGILAFANEDPDNNNEWAHWYAMALLPISLGFCLYALAIFLWRAERIKTRVPGRWDDPRGPIVLGSVLVAVLCLNFVVKIVEIVKYNRAMWGRG